MHRLLPIVLVLVELFLMLPTMQAQTFTPELEREIRAGNLTREEAAQLQPTRKGSSDSMTRLPDRAQPHTRISKPFTFLGLKFPQPFPGSIPRCTTLKLTRQICFIEYGWFVLLRNLSALSDSGLSDSAAIAILENNKLEGLLLLIPAARMNVLYRTLVATYGLPSTSDPDKIRSILGNSFNPPNKGEMALWVRDGYVIAYSSLWYKDTRKGNLPDWPGGSVGALGAFTQDLAVR
jgi:hypothetical protein